jgi:hypothetical protein
MTALKIFGVLMAVLSLVSCSDEYASNGSNQQSGGGSDSSSQPVTSQAVPPNVVVANNPPPTEAPPATPSSSTAGLNQCGANACGGSRFCEIATNQAGLGPPPQAEDAATAGLGPPPGEQAATATAGLGPPPPSPAAPAPAGPSSPGSSTTAMSTPPVVVPVPSSVPAPQPPTARYNPPNVCNPTPSAPSKPANVCNPTPPAISKPGNTGNICNPTGNAGQQTAAAPQNGPRSAPTGRMNSGECHTVNGQTTCTDASGNSCTTTGNFCDPTTPQPTKTAAPVPPKPNEGPLKLKPSTQMASAGQPCSQKSQNTSVPACDSKSPFLPWGGTGSAAITVTGGKPCSVGWHDTGATVLDSMTVTSPPSHGTLRPQDQHVIIFTPTSGYKGADSFSLMMQEHNGGRSATLRVNVSVTIQQ